MHDSAESCVRQNRQLLKKYSNVGVRQGEKLSPILFSLILNELVVLFLVDLMVYLI